MGPLTGPVMACVPRRMWWKPWKWQVTLWHWDGDGRAKHGGTIYAAKPTETIKNLSLEGAIGIMKLCGVEHKDFTESEWQ